VTQPKTARQEGRPRVLLVEADEELLDFLTRHLQEMGADPCSTHSAEQARSHIDQEKFDGVFLSLALPGANGLELIERVRWSRSNSRCPIILVCEERDTDQIRRAFRAGVNFLLAKPVTKKQLDILLNATRGLMLHERRRYQRVPCRVPVQCEWTVQSFFQRATGETINLSSSGMILKLCISPPPEAVIQAIFSLPGGRKLFNITARVTRASADQKVGLQFSELTEEERQQLLDFCSAVANQETTDSPVSG
jgi:CheY-like chemotaxis protein